jgi:hypothetical protein
MGMAIHRESKKAEVQPEAHSGSHAFAADCAGLVLPDIEQ